MSKKNKKSESKKKTKLLAIRIKGTCKTDRKIKEILSFLGLKKNNSYTVLENNKQNRHMLNKVQNWIAWGETGKKVRGKLNPPRGGFKSIRRHYPGGDLGYRGKDIEKLLERMKR